MKYVLDYTLKIPSSCVIVIIAEDKVVTCKRASFQTVPFLMLKKR